jgi:hypothetical protein
VTEKRLPIEDGDKQWISVTFHPDGSVFYAKYRFRKKDGTWSDQIRQVWGRDASLPEHVVIAGMHDAIAYKQEAILRIVDEITALKEALAAREGTA